MQERALLCTAAGATKVGDQRTGEQPSKGTWPSVRITRSLSSVTLFELDPGLFELLFAVSRKAERLFQYMSTTLGFHITHEDHKPNRGSTSVVLATLQGSPKHVNVINQEAV